MRLHLGFPSPAGSRTWIFAVLGLALAAACSDDGLANQSSGQNETSTTGGPVIDASNDDAAEDGPIPPPSTTAEPDGTTAASPSSTGEPDATTSGTGTIDPESVTETGTGTGTGTDGTATDGTTGGGNQACADGCAVEFTCGTEWASEADCVAWCEANLVKADAFSPFCRAAWENLSACLGTLTCEEFGVWQMPTEFPYPCSDADVVLSVECKGQ